MSKSLHSSLINVANLEKQLFLERESKDEFQRAVKREVVMMKKKAFVQEKHISDAATAMKASLAECAKIMKALEAPGLAKLSSNRSLQDIKQSVEIMMLKLGDEINPAVPQQQSASNSRGDLGKPFSFSDGDSSIPTGEPGSGPAGLVPTLNRSSLSDLVIEEDAEDYEDEGGSSHVTQEKKVHRHHHHHNHSPLSSSPQDGGFAPRQKRATTQDWQMEGRSASSEQMEVLLKEVYLMMCNSSNNADPNAADNAKKDASLESFMTLEEFLKFATLANLPDERLTMPRIEDLFNMTVRSSSRGSKKFSKRIQFDDFRSALVELAEIKFPYSMNGALDTLLTDYVWPLRSRQSIKKEIGDILQSHFDNAFFKGDVMSFMTTQNEALMKIFKRYANAMSSSSSSIREADIQEGEKRGVDMALDQFCQFAIDYNVVPQLLTQQGLMDVIRGVVGRKMKVSFTEFLRLIAKLAEEVYVDTEIYPTLLQKVEALFHEIDRGGSIFQLSKVRHAAEKNRRTSTIGKLQSVSAYAKASQAKGAAAKQAPSPSPKDSTGRTVAKQAPPLDSAAKEKRLSNLNTQRISNVNKMFMLK
jgi:hypothetical protein